MKNLNFSEANGIFHVFSLIFCNTQGVMISNSQMRIACFIQKISPRKSTFKCSLSSGEGLRNGKFHVVWVIKVVVGYTEELSKGVGSQKPNCIQLLSKSAFHSVAYFVSSAFSCKEHQAYSQSNINIETHFKIQVEITFGLSIPYFTSVYTNNQGLLNFQKLWRVLPLLQRYNGVCIKTIACFAMHVQLIDHFCQ